MPVTTTTVTTRSTTSSPGVAVHTISFRGLAGAIFLTLMAAAIIYVIGFATVAWTVRDSHHYGLWQSCQCNSVGETEDWFKATQAMITLGLIGLLIAMILACIYLCVHSISKNSTILALVVVCFLSVIFMLIGFLIYGIKMGDPNWSYALCVIAAIMTIVAGALAIVQMRQSGVRV